MDMVVTPSTATLGAVVHGVELRALDEASWSAIEQAFHEHAVLVFPEQFLDEAGALRGHEVSPHAIGAILRDAGPGGTFTAFLNELNDQKVGSDTMTPSDTFVNLFYAGSARFAETAYTLAREPQA